MEQLQQRVDNLDENLLIAEAGLQRAIC
jgi:hypothetical protein